MIVPLKINHKCLACPAVGYANVAFYFTKEGDLKFIKIVKFHAVKHNK